MDDLISFHNEVEWFGGKDASRQPTSKAGSPLLSFPPASRTSQAMIDKALLDDLLSDSPRDQEALKKLGVGTMATARRQPSIHPNSTRGSGKGHTVAPIDFHSAEEPLVKQWVDERLSRAQSGQHDDPPRRGRAMYFISHNPDFTTDIIEAIYSELSQVRSDFVFEIRGSTASTYLSIDAPSEELAVECLQFARSLADEIISDTTVNTAAIFLQPPDFLLDSVGVRLDYAPDLQATRPRILPRSTAFPNTVQRTEQGNAYMDHFCCQLSAVLKRVGRINSGFNLKVRLGHFFLLSYPYCPVSGGQPQAVYTFDQFSSLVQNPRTKGDVKSQIGDLRKALCVLGAIRRNGSPFYPESFSIASAAEVAPTFTLEASSNHYRIETHLQPTANVGVDGRAGPFKVASIRLYKKMDKTGGIGEMDIITLSLDKEFDWKIETVNELPEDDSLLRGLRGELRSAKVHVPGRGDNLDEYPRITFNNSERLSNQLNRVAIKSIYRFKFSATYYVVEFTIRREWKNIIAMTSGQVNPLVTFSVTVYGEHWGETRASEVAKTGRGWGEELEILFSDDLDQRSANANGQSRVRAFVETINAIRDALSANT